jgi:hypothetical protein
MTTFSDLAKQVIADINDDTLTAKVVPSLSGGVWRVELSGGYVMVVREAVPWTSPDGVTGEYPASIELHAPDGSFTVTKDDIDGLVLMCQAKGKSSDSEIINGALASIAQ